MNIETLLVATRTRDIDGTGVRGTMPPIHLSATFQQDSATEFGAYDYSRSGNPTRDALEGLLAELEGAARALAYPSGVAALNAMAALLRPGDEVLVSTDVYGGTYRLLSKVWSGRGVAVRYADLSDPAAARAAFSSRTRLVHAESLGNPLLTVCDVRGTAELAHAHGALLSIDNTSLTPLNLRPLELGADMVIHSATKYLCGHSDVTAGVLAVRDEALARTLKFHHNAEGCVLPPLDSYLLLRGMQTLAVRLERQEASARAVAEALLNEPCVSRVRFPGLPGHEGAAAHARQSKGTGAVVSFETGDAELSRRIVEALKLFSIRVSFGALNSSASVPFHMSHTSIPQELRGSHGPPRDLVRLAVGLEHAADLIADLRGAIAAALAYERPITAGGVA